MRIVLTGGAGYIGSHSLVAALARGHECLVLDNFSNSDATVIDRVEAIAGQRPALAVADVRDRPAVRSALAEFRPDAVVHFAGLKSVGDSNSDPALYYDVNVSGTLSIIDAMEASGCKRLVFSSSATVYGIPQYLPIDEAHPLTATNPYGRSKLFVEDILRDHARARPDWSIAILRYFNPVGAHASGLIGESPKGVPANLIPFVARVAAGDYEAVQVFGEDYDTPDGTGVRDYLHVEDLADAHVAAIDWTERKIGAEAFNLGTGRGNSVLEMIRIFSDLTGKPVPYRVAARRPGDVASCYADAGRAGRELGWQASRDIEAMCRSAWNWQLQSAAMERKEPR